MRSKQKFKYGLIIYGLIISFYLIIIFRLIHIQVFGDTEISKVDGKIYKQVIENELNTNRIFKPIRGNIYTRNNKLLATTVYRYKIFIDGSKIKNSDDKHEIMNVLFNNFKIDQQKIRNKIKREDKYIIIGRRVRDKKIKDFLKNLIANGVKPSFIKNEIDESELIIFQKYLKKIGIHCNKNDPVRVYPMGKLGSHVVGYLNYAGQGIGIEAEFDEFLEGEKSSDLNDLPLDGGDIYLTIDSNIQYFVEKAIKKGYKNYQPNAVSAVVLNPKTGDILSMANYPTYDPNYFYRVKDSSSLINKAIAHSFEPGSTFKLVTLSGAFEEKLISKNMQIDCNNGVIKYEGETIRDTLNNKILSLSEVFEKSSNVGAVKIADMMGKEDLYYYTKLFGFTENKTVALSNESKAYVRSPDKWAPSELANFSIGYGLATNLLRLTNSYAVVANSGKLMETHIISKIKRNNKVSEISPLEIRRVLDKETAKKVTDILVNVVDNGSAYRTRMKNLKIAGKTGTAIVFNRKEQKYKKDEYIGTFVGYFPAYNPKYVIGIMVNKPKTKGYASKFAVPIFKEIADDLVVYGGVE
ncbi:MAG: penicillin-binding protein 2 [Candidatus Mcinerneyibacterium aminivorans]|jgi:cell division protein FtsI/penicillin-binding protein 2|uniref:Penicillin-binding protein 2 n=1 Tax=Candidatus Mcinerneyibacterium aminivorans TaxID=2703815 RepID=A0A5D0MAH9_9BACT|nr:MAG: penicillin-binding protein 2 [Candidatus Mcinerneyibacterium aminivorans]